MQTNSSVLITDYVHPNMLLGLRDAGYRYTYAPEIERDLVLTLIQEYTGIVINTKTRADRDLINRAKNLRFIARLGSGLEIIDLDAAAEKQIHVFRAPDANANAVAEHAVGMLLSLLRNLRNAGQGLAKLRFEREENRGTEIEGKTIGIIGFGNTGSRTAEKFQGWGARILAYDKYLVDYTAKYSFVEESSLEYLLKASDIVSLHLPLTRETEYLVDGAFLQHMKPGAVLVNTSRGKIIDTKAIMEALNTGKLRGVCLDVFENEKPGTYENREEALYRDLFARENVVATPHIAGWTIESKRKISDSLLDKIKTV